MTLDEAIEALRERRVDSSVARLLNTVAMYLIDRADEAIAKERARCLALLRGDWMDIADVEMAIERGWQP
jgi:hypothetical protein